ncbi:Protein SRG1 [Mucuna pruriens]|uniref:Protein SRG1 n=1 Tax=Mucuna pruriens TaxID=157652 RepID=A0A371E3A4_MUCPR|nr:Protein SRG1 [Mucuna pruriens]
MDSIAANLESSLSVPSVQELAFQRPEKVPPRYIRDEDGDDIIGTYPSEPSLRVPFIDMAKLVNANTHQHELHKLHLACKDWGVFQLVNHGVSNTSLKNMGNQVQRFFELPLQEKKRWAQRPGSLEGYGQAFVTSEDQKLDWNDMIFLKCLPIQNRKLDLWPQNPPEFRCGALLQLVIRETLERYSEDIRKVTISIVKFITMSLGLQDTQLSESFREGLYDTRMNCYPPCPEPERVLGIVPHADNSGITLLLDCADFPALQFLKDKKWVNVEPIEGAIVVNIGQIIEVMSNGIYKAPEHRAVVNKLKERFSIVTFCYPSPCTDIGPVDKLIREGEVAVYKKLTHAEYFTKFFNRDLEESFIDSLRV